MRFTGLRRVAELNELRSDSIECCTSQAKRPRGAAAAGGCRAAATRVSRSVSRSRGSGLHRAQIVLAARQHGKGGAHLDPGRLQIARQLAAAVCLEALERTRACEDDVRHDALAPQLVR